VNGMTAGRELDAIVAEKVMGKEVLAEPMCAIFVEGDWSLHPASSPEGWACYAGMEPVMVDRCSCADGPSEYTLKGDERLRSREMDNATGAMGSRYSLPGGGPTLLHRHRLCVASSGEAARDGRGCHDSLFCGGSCHGKRRRRGSYGSARYMPSGATCGARRVKPKRQVKQYRCQGCGLTFTVSAPQPTTTRPDEKLCCGKCGSVAWVCEERGRAA
jgi:hypothetical protein